MPGGTRARGGPRGLRRGGAASASRAHPNITRRARGGRRAARAGRSSPPGPLTSDGWRRPSPRGSASAALAFYDAIAPIVSRGLARPRAALRALALRQGRGRRLPQRPDVTRDEYEAFIDALLAADQFTGPRVRRGAVLRGLPAGRGDGAPRAGDAALRPDEAGGPARSAHRPGAVRRGAAPAGGPGGADVEPGRLPDAAPDSGAAAGVPHDPGPRARRSSSGSAASTATATSTARRASARRSPRATTTGSSSPASSPASRATPSRSAPGLLAGINLARRLAGQAARGAAADHDARRAVPLSARGRSRRTSSR